MIARRSTLLGLLALLTFVGPSAASAGGKCGEGGVHADAVRAAREAIRESCDCAGSADHATYLRCARNVIQQRATAGELPKRCRGRVRRFADRSTCGRDDKIACCVLFERGPWRPLLREAADGCGAPDAIGWCESYFEHLEYSCLPEGACRVNQCGDGILDRRNGEGCEPPGVGLCDPWCQVIVCGNGVIDPGEECEPPRTPICDYTCRTTNCGDGVVDPQTEQCEPPNTPTCDSLCYFTHDCGNGVVDAGWGEECEPPGTATCDASCKFIHTCGNGVIEPGEECDGQEVCGSGCSLPRAACCDFGDACIGGTASSDLDAYFNFFKPCFQILGGSLSFGVCEGPPCPPPAPPGLDCRLSSCSDRAIDPLPLCCQQAAGGCRDTIAETAGAIGSFNCSSFPPPDRGDVDRIMIGSCGEGGVCVPAN